MSSDMVGEFVYRLTSDTWSWSDSMYRLYGFEPGEVTPSTALVTAHLPGDDRERVLELFADALRGAGTPVSVLHRIETSDRERTVVTLVHRATDTGAPPELRGYTSDVTVHVNRAATRKADQDVKAAIDGHSVVDQAIGVLMLAHGVDNDTAFSLLRWFSQHTNTKLRTLAERLVEGARTRVDLPAETAQALDSVLSDATLTEAAQPAGAPRRDELHTRLAAEGDEALLRVRGPVDLAGTPVFAEALGELSGAAHQGRRLVVDLSDVTYLASAAVAELHRFQHHAERRNRDVKIVPPARLPDSAALYLPL
ncbi:ANTAR domain-containing protein [Streptomyces sp. TRM 70351]|uniref:ANTAR domain-containing protein n=1 Tax=Streptomyces sp. TRM 70351 TaxID=3116552 RepID=UPI002E7B6020|nr:ANTAR domain-containing protein [Streptomyces sp. TRM 70351]MEE1930337.1 ANTAR domain-containing protein [Streptomyces sp. TRM 70351]